LVYRSRWGRVASPRRGVIDTGRMAAVARTQQRPLIAETPNACHIRSAGEIVAGPVSSAEAAQARLFENTLQAELHRLRNLEKLMTLRGTGPGSDEQQAGEELRELSAGIEEVNHLLKALRDRFLHAG
jgi:hypothetical protein